MVRVKRFCADWQQSGPFSFGRELLRQLLAEPVASPLPAKTEVVRAFLSPEMPVDPRTAPLLLSTAHDLRRLQVLPQRHLTFLCHATADVVEQLWRNSGTVEVCHLETADETDRELTRVLTERARFRGRPDPIRVVRHDHEDPTGNNRDSIDFLTAVQRGYYEFALRVGSDLTDQHGWPADYDEDLHIRLHAYSCALSAVGRPTEAVQLYQAMACRWSVPAVQASAHYTEAMYYTRYGGPDVIDLHRADECLRRAISAAESDPDEAARRRRSAFFENSLALIDMFGGRIDQALRRIDTALSILGQQDEPQLRMAFRNNRAILLIRLGRPEEAVADLDSAVAYDPGSASSLIDRAMALQTAGRLDDALADLDTAINNLICGPEAYTNRALLQIQKGRTELALDDLRWARFLDSSDDAILLQLLEMLIEAGEHDEAAAVVAGNPQAYAVEGFAALRARLSFAQGHQDAALRILADGLRDHPRSAVIRLERATILHALGQPAEALTEVEAALAQDGSDPLVEANRILLLTECGRESDARTAAEQLLSTPLDDDLRAHIRQLVATP